MIVIGLMSGTSVDGIDAALVEITGTDFDLNWSLLKGATFPYPTKLQKEILAVAEGKPLSLQELTSLDQAIAGEFALAAQKIQSDNLKAELIGSHGQTVYHQPPQKQAEKVIQLGASWQLGRGEIIAHQTGITTVSNFRAADIAAGGEGAPLVPKVDLCLLSDADKDRCIQNLGGIGNFTYIPARNRENWREKICGWDTGPGNCLIDLAVEQLTGGEQHCDYNGSWAAKGKPCQELVNKWLQQDFFQQTPPKSTGRELFGHSYLAQCWQDAQVYQLNDADWLATLTELTVASIVDSYVKFLPQLPTQMLLCGGGSRNLYLKQRLQYQLASVEILTTETVGLSGELKEAIAFAVLAYWRFNCSFPGNLPQVTGAKKPMLLGDVHFPCYN